MDDPRYTALLDRIETLMQDGRPVRLAIDGRCGAGKSTLAEHLSEALSAPIVHMDDFYVPLAQKTPERLSIPGGNVCWERVLDEVLSRPAGEPFSYCPFDCRTQALSEERTVPEHRLLIVEGSYSMHPQLRSCYALSVFLTLEPAAQRERLLARNGPEGLTAFTEKWIPLEEHYFRKEGIRRLCTLTIDVSKTPLFR